MGIIKCIPSWSHLQPLSYLCLVNRRAYTLILILRIYHTLVVHYFVILSILVIQINHDNLKSFPTVPLFSATGLSKCSRVHAQEELLIVKFINSNWNILRNSTPERIKFYFIILWIPPDSHHHQLNSAITFKYTDPPIGLPKCPDQLVSCTFHN